MSLDPRATGIRPIDERPGIDSTEPPARPDHLEKTDTDTYAPTTLPREWRCKECGNRITQSQDGNREYGHARRPRCEHFIDDQD